MTRTSALAVVTVVGTLLAGACADDSGAPESSSGEATTSTVAPTGEERTPDEQLAIDALVSLGLQADRAEHPGPRGASIQGTAGGVVLYLSSGQAGIEPEGVTVSDEREIRGIAVATVEYASAPGPRTRFDCGDLTYEIASPPGSDVPVPPGFASHDELVERLLVELGC